MNSGRKIARLVRVAGICSVALIIGLTVIPHVMATTYDGAEMIGDLPVDSSLLNRSGKLAYANDTLYIVESGKNCIQAFDSHGNHQNRVTFNRPSAIAVDAGGNMYVGSNIDYSVAILQSGNVTGYLGDGSYEFWSVSDIAIDSGSGNVYVADNVGNAVFVYGPAGKQVMVIDGLNTPKSVEIVEDKVYILDFPIVQVDSSATTTVSRVSVYDKSGNQMSSFVARGNQNSQVTSPTDISVVGDRIYVSDAFLKAVLVYDLSGTYMGQVSSSGDVYAAASLTVSPEGIMYVSSSETQNIQMFDLGTGSGDGAGVDKIGGGL